MQQSFFAPNSVSMSFVFYGNDGQQPIPGFNNIPQPQGIMNLLQQITSGFLPNLGGDLLDQLFHQHQPRFHATSKDVLSRIPRIKITQELFDQKLECAVCKDVFNISEEGLKLPCGDTHVFHSDCIKPWLEQHNTCPVCRYELPVDDPEYEKERKKRMASRSVNEVPIQNDQNSFHQEVFTKTTEPSEPIGSPGKAEIKTNQLVQPLKNCEVALLTKVDCALLKEEEFIALSCGHTFHTECLDTYLRVAGRIDSSESMREVTRAVVCPSCRKDVKALRDLDVD